MHRCALLLGFALSLISASAAAQECDGFTDVLASSPFCPDVIWLAGFGITRGCTPTQFCPDENVTRLQMAAFLHRLGQNPAFVDGGNAFGKQATIGTSDNAGLVVVVDGQQALLVQPAVDTIYEYYGFNPNVVAGQAGNTVSAGVSGATIAGGGGCNLGTGGTCPIASANTVSGVFGTVGGGVANSAGGFATTVAGGQGNVANSYNSTVAGGENNTASGGNSTVAGGFQNTASGTGSFAAGIAANADQNGCFVFTNWSTIPGSYFSCLGVANIAKFGLDHGLSVDYGAALMSGAGSRYVAIGDTSAGNTINAWSGAVLTDGGTWTNASDRALKTDFSPVDAQAVLAKVAQLPIDEWRYKTEDGQRHLGPVAQDFYAAFGLGADDRHITTVDEGGVALAAIKGLNAKVDAQQREIVELRERVQKAEAVAADVVALRAALAALQGGREAVALK